MELRALTPESYESHTFSLGSIYQDRKLYNDLQREKLMPLAYSLRHPQESQPEDHNLIPLEWIARGDAQKVEEYITTHPEEELDIENEEQIKELLFKIDPEIQKDLETLH